MKTVWSAALVAAMLAACGGSSGPGPAVVSVSVQPASVTLGGGGAQAFSVAVGGTSDPGVTWSVREGAAGGTITAAGGYRAPAAAGVYHVVAASVVDPARTGVATVTVTAAPAIALLVTPSQVSLTAGDSQRFAAEVTGTADTSVTWSVQGGAAGGTISSAGLYSAASAGTFRVIATSKADTSVQASATVVVTAAGATTSVLGSPLCLTGDSKVLDRYALRLAERDGLQHPVPPGVGTVQSTSGTAGLSTWSYSDSNLSEHQYFTYDSGARLTRWQQTWSTSAPTQNEYLTYSTSGALTQWQRTWSNSSPTEHEYFTFDSGGRLTQWERTWSDATPTEHEYFTFDTGGRLTQWEQTWSDATPTIHEYYTFDSGGRLTQWERTWSDATPTVHEYFTYNASGQLTGATCTNCQGTPTFTCR
jgi:hypothetical protein